MTDNYGKKIDATLADKEKDIIQNVIFSEPFWKIV
jgi:hypothetical protein